MSILKLAGAALALILSASNVSAKSYVWPDRHSPTGYVSIPISRYYGAPRQHVRKTVRKVTVRKARRVGSSISLAHVTPKLAAKAAQIISTCGSRVVSGHRSGARIAGTGRPSLHARYPAEAVDMAGNPKCIYAALKGWPGGYSVDYRSAGHVHISLASDRRERGSRFAHGGHRHYARRSVSRDFAHIQQSGGF